MYDVKTWFWFKILLVVLQVANVGPWMRPVYKSVQWYVNTASLLVDTIMDLSRTDPLKLLHFNALVEQPLFEVCFDNCDKHHQRITPIYFAYLAGTLNQ